MNFDLSEHGFAIIRGVLSPFELEPLTDALGVVSGAGRRGVLAVPQVSALAGSKRILDLVRPHLNSTPTPVRAIFFDKSPEKNWFVTWHQDLTLAVRSRAEVPGFGPWSVKDGIPHVQPPAELLEQMVTIRLHLDSADETNGALRAMPGSHRKGRLSAEHIQALRSGESQDVLCTVAAGDVLLMRPLILHASSRSTSTRHRRILHIEYAGFTLPPELQWHEEA